VIFGPGHSPLAVRNRPAPGFSLGGPPVLGLSLCYNWPAMPVLRTVAFGIFYAIFLILLIPVLAVALVLGMRGDIIHIGQWSVRVGCLILGVRVSVSGFERVDPRAPCIFMANHLSFLDGPLLAMAVRRTARIILKKSLFRIPILGLAMRHVGFVPVDRKGHRGGQRSLRRAARLMREKGWSFLVFPEGTRSRDGKMLPFRRGGFFLALESGAPIVPVTIDGTYELMPKGQWYSRSGGVRIIFHDPVPVAGSSPETMPELMERVRASVASGLARSG